MKKEEEIYKQKVDYKAIFLHFLNYKFLFIGFLILFCSIAYLYNKYSPPVYENYTTILVNKKDIYSFLSSEDLSSGFGQFYQKSTHEDEFAILQSFSLVNAAITKVNAMISYYNEESMIGDNNDGVKFTNDLYNSAPFEVQIDKTRPQPMDLEIQIKFHDKESFEINAHGKDVWLYNFSTGKAEKHVPELKIEGTYKFGEVIQDENYQFRVEKFDWDSTSFIGKTYYFAFNHLSYLTLIYASELKIESSDVLSSIFTIKMRGKNPDRITDFLNALTSVYLEQNLQKKNRIVDNTIDFIDQQINSISDSLVYTEARLEGFKQKNKVTDLSFQGERIFDKMNELESEKAILLVKRKYYMYIIDYFKRNKDATDLAAPATMSVEDEVLNTLISNLTNYYTERAGMLETGKSIFLEETEAKIRNTKSAILQNVRSNSSKLNIEIADINRRIQNLNAEIEQLPKTERELFGIERNFKLNDAIYTFLLEKRANAQIAKASNTSDYEVIDPARRISAKQVSPKRRFSFLLAIFFGILIPIIIILIKDFMRSHINANYEKVKTAGYPVIGNIFKGNRRKVNAIIEDPRSNVAESVRAVCTNIQFQNKSKSILIGSTKENEGKTFAAINIAFGLAEMGRKTLLVDTNLRTPAIKEYLNIEEEKSIQSYFTGEQALNDIKIADYAENLDVIVCNAAVPNPHAAYSSGLINEIIENEASNYHHIIFDTSGLEEYSESLLLMKACDMVIFVARNKKTTQSELTLMLENLKGKEFDNIYVLLNSLQKSRKTYKIK